MLKGTEYLDEQLHLVEIFTKDVSTELVRATHPIPFPLTICVGVRAILGEKAKRVSQTLEYRNGPLRMSVDRVLSRKRRGYQDWGETVDVALDIRFALGYGKSGKITTPEELLAVFRELYGPE